MTRQNSHDHLVRPNIRSLTPYRCARDDFATGILLDANENSFGSSLSIADEQKRALHRYPDPHQLELKRLLCSYRSSAGVRGLALTPANMFCGNGSDEAIDLLVRVFCQPSRDRILICPPTYGMYKVCAQVNDIEAVAVPLDPVDFQLRVDVVLEALVADSSVKVVFLCSPGNPTGTILKLTDIQRILSESRDVIVVVDEAYIDFSPMDKSALTLLPSNDRLVVMQTLSKAFGLAGVRVGMAWASEWLVHYLNAIKPPYNISSPALELACRAFLPESLQAMHHKVDIIKNERSYLLEGLLQMPGVKRLRGGQDANFLLVECTSTEFALDIYTRLANLATDNVVIRFRGKEPLCSGCLRITVGTRAETDILLKQWKSVCSSQ
eukprot:Partr_v1_DN27871_c2_g2_i1_m22964 putative Histidinol-phosphate aminotransferase